MNPLKTFICTFNVTDKDMIQTAIQPLYDVKINSLKGQPIDLVNLRAKKYFLLMWLLNVVLLHNIKIYKNYKIFIKNQLSHYWSSV